MSSATFPRLPDTEVEFGTALAVDYTLKGTPFNAVPISDGTWVPHTLFRVSIHPALATTGN